MTKRFELNITGLVAYMDLRVRLSMAVYLFLDLGFLHINAISSFRMDSSRYLLSHKLLSLVTFIPS